MKRGLPRCVLSDNGSAMLAGEYENGLDSLGVNYRTTLPYSPYQNGKQETFWQVLEGRCLAMLERVSPLTLEFLNRATQAWVEHDYNRGIHEELKMAPLQKLLNSPNQGRPSPTMATLQHAFCLVTKRHQRHADGTVSIHGVRFEIPSAMRTLRRITLRCRRWDLSEAFIVQPDDTMKILHRITPLDKARYADGRRRALDAAYPTLAGGCASQPVLPPLMTQWLADYAATGAPPAFIPLPTEENADERE
jgi:hypothetical protein